MGLADLYESLKVGMLRELIHTASAKTVKVIDGVYVLYRADDRQINPGYWTLEIQDKLWMRRG
jgi:hypothetical protein